MTPTAQIARELAGVQAPNGDFIQPPASDQVRAATFRQLDDGQVVYLQLRDDTLEVYRQARRVVADDDQPTPATFRAPGWLEPFTERLETIHRNGAASFTLRRDVVRQGRFGSQSRMAVRAVTLEQGQPQPLGLKKAVSLLTRFGLVLEAVDDATALERLAEFAKKKTRASRGKSKS